MAACGSAGAPLRACVAGCGLSSDALHPTAPPTDAEGAVRAMREALARAHLTPADITYVNAHGTGTVQNDRAEAVALADVFGPGNVLVSSTKSLIGHTMGAAGALEAVATIGALETGLVPPRPTSGSRILLFLSTAFLIQHGPRRWTVLCQIPSALVARM